MSDITDAIQHLRAHLATNGGIDLTWKDKHLILSGIDNYEKTLAVIAAEPATPKPQPAAVEAREAVTRLQAALGDAEKLESIGCMVKCTDLRAITAALADDGCEMLSAIRAAQSEGGSIVAVVHPDNLGWSVYNANVSREILDQAPTMRRMRAALHDAIRRPMGVVPDSAAEFYDPRLADDAEARRPLPPAPAAQDGGVA